jgi:hypothetical protein
VPRRGSAIVISLLVGGCARASGGGGPDGGRLVVGKPALTLDNRLARCVDVGEIVGRTSGNLVLAEATLTFKQSVGQCGCPSALLSYSVVEKVDVAGGAAVEYERLFGRLRSLAAGQRRFVFVIGTDAELTSTTAPTLRMGCARAD